MRAKMTGIQYKKKVKDYLRNHLNHIVIHRLRTNQPLTQTDLEGLEKTLMEIGEENGETLLSGLLERNGSPSLAYFIRNMVGNGLHCRPGCFLPIPWGSEPDFCSDSFY